MATTWPNSHDGASGRLRGRRRPALAIVGDGAVVRFQIATYDSGWIEPKAFAKVSEFSPRVSIQIDLARLREAVQQSPPGRNKRSPLLLAQLGQELKACPRWARIRGRQFHGRIRSTIDCAASGG